MRRTVTFPGKKGKIVACRLPENEKKSHRDGREEHNRSEPQLPQKHDACELLL
jgi:hypothetical protein